MLKAFVLTATLTIAVERPTSCPTIPDDICGPPCGELNGYRKLNEQCALDMCLLYIQMANDYYADYMQELKDLANEYEDDKNFCNWLWGPQWCHSEDIGCIEYELRNNGECLQEARDDLENGSYAAQQTYINNITALRKAFLPAVEQTCCELCTIEEILGRGEFVPEEPIEALN